MSIQEDYVLKTLESRDVHFVRFWFVDVLGTLKSFAVIPGELETAFDRGMGFDASCVEGFSSMVESDMLAFPDASTFQVLPWRPDSNAVARMFCSIRKPDGSPFEGDPRQVLSNMVHKAQDMGFMFNVGPELEYYYFKDDSSTEVLDRGGYFDLTGLDNASDLRRDTVLMLENMGIPVEYSHHEGGPSQNEIDLRYTDAMSMADAVMTYKLIVKEVARRHGVYASFMPKPLPNHPGNGMHVHQSLFTLDGANAFFDENDSLGIGLSETAKYYLAGLLTYANEYALITNPCVNSYKRIATRNEAPAYISWSHKNRTTMARIPGYRPDTEHSCRIELRNPDPSSNPYLAFAVMLAAGLKGIKQKLELVDPVDDLNLNKMDASEIERLHIEMFPQSLGEAIEHFSSSELMKETLGTHIHQYLIEAKTAEWNEYQRSVSQWEYDRYLAFL